MDLSKSTLKSRLISMIKSSGPISVATYMDLCLHDRQEGYYATRPGLGEDFITAPEISQTFGELLGLWLANEWQTLGRPDRLTLVEVGPGRGTLLADALRTSGTVAGFSDAIQLHLLEPSPILQDHLSAKFETFNPVFLTTLEDLPTDAPVLLIANEWLDCLPVQQYVRVGDAWHERVIGLSDEDALTFGLNVNALPADIRPDDRLDQLEVQPGLKTLIEALETLFAQTPGRALLIDYGPADRMPADTLRSYKAGKQIHPLMAPGESDLTCDVDFARLAYLARQSQLRVDGPISQSQLLLSLGAEARLNQLAKQNPDQAETLYQGIRRLIDPEEMGQRFQAICLSRDGLPIPAAF